MCRRFVTVVAWIAFTIAFAPAAGPQLVPATNEPELGRDARAGSVDALERGLPCVVPSVCGHNGSPVEVDALGDASGDRLAVSLLGGAESSFWPPRSREMPRRVKIA